MKEKSRPGSAIFKIRILIGLVFFFTGVCLTLFSASGPQQDAPLQAAQLRRVNGAQLSPLGGVQESWVARYNGPGNYTDDPAGIAVDASGNVYVTGESSGQGGLMGYATIKYNSAGEEQWVARYNGPGNGNDSANAIAVDASGNVYVTGQSLGQGTGIDYATIKYNSAGQQQWSRDTTGQLVRMTTLQPLLLTAPGMFM